MSVAAARGSSGEKAAEEEGELDTLLQQLSDARQVILCLGYVHPFSSHYLPYFVKCFGYFPTGWWAGSEVLPERVLLDARNFKTLSLKYL